MLKHEKKILKKKKMDFFFFRIFDLGTHTFSIKKADIFEAVAFQLFEKA